MIDQQSRIFVAGHNGMVGSAIVKELNKRGYSNIITRSRRELDLTSQTSVSEFFAKEIPEVVFLAAAKVGGIQANINFPSEFLYENLAIQNNVIWSSFKGEVKKFIFLGSSCIYPKECKQPMKEEYILTGKLEPTNEGYALAKIAGLKLVEFLNTQYSFPGISIMPCNLYGPNDSFDLAHSHVLSALVKRFVDAKETHLPEVTLWGSGNARREFMHSDDCAAAAVYMMNVYDKPEFVNIGWGTDVSIKELALMLAEKIGYKGEIKWDITKPDGIMRKCMQVDKMKSLGFEPRITLQQGLEEMIKIYRTIKTNI